jgi:hypothetical protein
LEIDGLSSMVVMTQLCSACQHVGKRG